MEDTERISYKKNASVDYASFEGESLLSRDQALTLVNENIKKRNVLFHVLAVEAIMRSTAKFLGENEDMWGLVGLLHDVDYEKTETTPEVHSTLSEGILRGRVTEDVVRAIKSHNYSNTHVMPESRMEKALLACDAVSGLLVACALVMPSRRIADVKVETISKKFKDKDFARGADRQRIAVCEDIGIPREKFFEISLDGLRLISADIGL
jgi:putative nucleotidyltransferase with HDIG domain